MKQILIVDDESQILEILQEEFEDAGYKVITASNGLDAINLLQKNNFSAVISDYKMPRGTGLNILQFTTTMPKEKRPLFFFQSGFSVDFASEAYRLGAKAIFNKPYMINDLREAVELAINEKVENTIQQTV